MIDVTKLFWGSIMQQKFVLPTLADYDGQKYQYIAISPVEILDCHRAKENWALEGVPITNDILQKIDFIDLTEGDFIWEYKHICVFEDSYGNWFIRYALANLPVKYLHELQLFANAWNIKLNTEKLLRYEK